MVQPGGDLSGRDFADADLSGADLRDVDLSGADLTGADLSDANLRNADLGDADLTGTDLTGADLRNANLVGADLTDAALSGVALRNAILEPDGETDAEEADEDTPLASAVATLVTVGTLALAFGLMGLGWSQFWLVFVFGFAVVLPLAMQAVEWYEARDASGGADADGDRSDADTRADAASGQSDALAALRRRYANGEIDDDEFERRVERLLETESDADAEAFYGESDSGSTGPEREVERE